MSASNLRSLAREMQSGGVDETRVAEILEAEAAGVDELRNDNYALRSDRFIYRIVVIALGIVAVATVIGVILVLLVGIDDSSDGALQVLTALGSASIGALAGLLAPSPGGSRG